MALTMTRTRTQTALTSFVTMVANVHGELVFVEETLAALEARAGAGRRPGQRSAAEQVRLHEGLERRRQELQAEREALYLTVRQFDSELDPARIGTAEDWLRPFGRGGAGKKRYLSFGWEAL